MKYKGGCHCGKVKYNVELELKQVIECNCSICSKRGSLLDFAPVEKFELLSGQENLTDYQFNKHVLHHEFCKTCGILSFARGKTPEGQAIMAINVRCLDGVDLKPIPVVQYDGKSK